jgi:hypothetical protein
MFSCTSGPTGTIVARRNKRKRILNQIATNPGAPSMSTKRSKLQKLLILFLAAYLTCGPAAMLVSAQQASGADYDEPAITVQSLLSILQTLPFDLFEVDVNTLGVSDTDPELMNAGINGYDSPDPSADSADASISSTDPKMFIVDDDHQQCPNAQYETIQEAVDAAGVDGNTDDRDKIKVCPGRYIEQVKIEGPQYNNLRLFGRNSVDTKSPTAPPDPSKEAIIEAPPVLPPSLSRDRSIVLVSDAQNVLIRHFFITGPAANIWAGVFVAGGASATIRHNHITQIKGGTGPFIQNGHGVAVGRGADGEIGSACVRHNLIDNYQKTGVLVDNLGTSAEVRHNEIMGLAAETDPVAQNGIQISRNARAEVRHNKVSQNRFGCCSSTTDSVGILTQDENNTDSTTCFGSCTPISSPNPSLLVVRENKVFQNDVGIGLGRATFLSLFDHNRPFDNRRVGLRAYGTTKNGGTTTPEAAQNTISYNKMENNPLDCSDQTTGSGTATRANYWIKDKGDTEDAPPGICKK